METKTFKIKIKGITPLICHRFTEENQLKASSGTSMTLRGDEGAPRDIAEKALYFGTNGYKNKPIWPGPNIFSCIIEAGKFFKAGKSKITTQKSSLIPACVSILDLQIPIDSKKGWEVDTRPVRNPSTGGRFLCHRPMFHDWEMTFDAEVETSMIAENLFRDIVDAAGRRIGFGSFRPACKGPYGKWVVTEWRQI